MKWGKDEFQDKGGVVGLLTTGEMYPADSMEVQWFLRNKGKGASSEEPPRPSSDRDKIHYFSGTRAPPKK
eukprot:g992.t1